MVLVKLIIDWQQMPTYNTIMALAAGAGLCSVATTMKRAAQGDVQPEGWALNFGVLGGILFLTGLHMTLSWPLAKYFPFDNIIFGEPSLAFGVLLGGLAFYCWKRGALLVAAREPLALMAGQFRHLRFFLYGLGLALVGIAVAGVTFGLFAAPPEEPITGLFADYPMLEATGISLLYAGVGVALLLLPGVLDRLALGGSAAVPASFRAVYWLMMITGGVWILFGALNYFTHIGLIVHTMG